MEVTYLPIDTFAVLFLLLIILSCEINSTDKTVLELLRMKMTNYLAIDLPPITLPNLPL